jgi:hypothetical protein
MSEMALTAEHLVVAGRGRLIADVSMSNSSIGQRGARFSSVPLAPPNCTV